MLYTKLYWFCNLYLYINILQKMRWALKYMAIYCWEPVFCPTTHTIIVMQSFCFKNWSLNHLFSAHTSFPAIYISYSLQFEAHGIYLLEHGRYVSVLNKWKCFKPHICYRSWWQWWAMNSGFCRNCLSYKESGFSHKKRDELWIWMDIHANHKEPH